MKLSAFSSSFGYIDQQGTAATPKKIFEDTSTVVGMHNWHVWVKHVMLKHVHVPHKWSEAKFRKTAFSGLVRISHRQHIPLKFFSISAFTLCTGSQYVIPDI